MTDDAWDGTQDRDSSTTTSADDLGTVAGSPAARTREKPLDQLTHYRLTQPLGRGGMGEVLGAHDDVIGREVAIKRMLTPNPTPQQIDRFLREARIQGTLDHPSIPPVYELAHGPDGRPYFVMKKLTGITLSQILKGIAKGDAELAAAYPRQRLLRAFTEVCLAVERANTRGVIHRDLKPANIMLGDFGEVYVLDWGVAKVIGTDDPDLSALTETPPGELATQAGAAIGTPGYMAPEQRGGTEIDARADVYALGCVLYELLAIKQFRGAASPAIPDLAPELAELWTSATRFDRDQRPRSARELGDGVQRYLDGDRDLALRNSLAMDHLARARAAVELGDPDQIAMREAGRALALDPTLPGAAELVGRLMIEPPSVLPPEAEASFERAQTAVAIQQSKIGMFAYLAYIAFLPGLLWIGIWAPGYMSAIVALVATVIGLAWYTSRHPPAHTGYPPRAVATVLANATIIALFVRLTSPFLLAPSIASVVVAVLIGSPIYRNPKIVTVLVVAFVIAILGPWFAELGGWIAPTVAFGDRTITLIPIAERIDGFAVSFGLSLYAAGILAFTALLVLKRAKVDEVAQRRIHFQTWRLRQLVPDPSRA